MEPDSIYILGAGSIGMALAVHLVNRGRKVIVVRTSQDAIEFQGMDVSIKGGDGKIFRASFEMVSLARLKRLAGIIVVTAKSYANRLIASRLKEMEVTGPVVILQNGVGVEQPYLELENVSVYRCVLYVSGQKNSDDTFTFIPITTSLVGVVRGDEDELEYLIGQLDTNEFPFRAQDNIQQEVWKKAAINAVFNSICPLLEIDNGIFIHDERAALVAREVVDECVAVMQYLGFIANAEEIMQQVFAISKRSQGQLISTLQDIRSGKETEIDSLNLEIARIGESAVPPVNVRTTRVLGEMVKIKSIILL